MSIQENKSFVWTHKLIIKYLYGWTRKEVERIISRILDIYPCASFNFVVNLISHCKDTSSNARIRVWRTAKHRATGRICWNVPLYAVGRVIPSIGAVARISPTIESGALIVSDDCIYAYARIQPSISSNANIIYTIGAGAVIQPTIGSNALIVSDDCIYAYARIQPSIGANANIVHTIGASAVVCIERYSIPLYSDARVVYVYEKVTCANSRIVHGFGDLDNAQGNVKIGRLRGCDLKGDLPLTGWRFSRNGLMEHIVMNSSKKVLINNYSLGKIHLYTGEDIFKFKEGMSIRFYDVSTDTWYDNGGVGYIITKIEPIIKAITISPLITEFVPAQNDFMLGIYDIHRWSPKITQMEIWFNPLDGDTNGDIMKDSVESLLDYYYSGYRNAIFVSNHRFKLEGNYTSYMYEGVCVRFDSPDYCCRVYQAEIQELAYFKWLIQQYPYQIAYAKILESITLKSNAKINDDLPKYGTVISSRFDGTYTIVDIEGEPIKNSGCLTVSWRENYDSVETKKEYYPFSSTARIRAYLRSTGKIFWLIGPPSKPGHEKEYAYCILEVGE